MKFSEKTKEKVSRRLGIAVVAALEEALIGMSVNERQCAVKLFHNLPQAGNHLAVLMETFADAMEFDITRTLPDFGDATEVSGRPVGHSPSFGRDDFKKCLPTIDADKTYVQQLEFDRIDMLEKLAALQTQIQTAKDGLAANSKTKYVDGLRALSADPRAMAAKRQQEAVIHSISEAISRQVGNERAIDRRLVAEGKHADRMRSAAKNYLSKTTKR